MSYIVQDSMVKSWWPQLCQLSYHGTGLYGQIMVARTVSNHGTGLYGQIMVATTMSYIVQDSMVKSWWPQLCQLSYHGTGLYGQIMGTRTVSNHGTGLYGQIMVATTMSYIVQDSMVKSWWPQLCHT